MTDSTTRHPASSTKIDRNTNIQDWKIFEYGHEPLQKMDSHILSTKHCLGLSRHSILTCNPQRTYRGCLLNLVGTCEDLRYAIGTLSPVGSWVIKANGPGRNILFFQLQSQIMGRTMTACATLKGNGCRYDFFFSTSLLPRLELFRLFSPA